MTQARSGFEAPLQALIDYLETEKPVFSQGLNTLQEDRFCWNGDHEVSSHQRLRIDCLVADFVAALRRLPLLSDLNVNINLWIATIADFRGAITLQFCETTIIGQPCRDLFTPLKELEARLQEIALRASPEGEAGRYVIFFDAEPDDDDDPEEDSMNIPARNAREAALLFAALTTPLQPGADWKPRQDKIFSLARFCPDDEWKARA